MDRTYELECPKCHRRITKVVVTQGFFSKSFYAECFKCLYYKKISNKELADLLAKEDITLETL